MAASLAPAPPRPAAEGGRAPETARAPVEPTGRRVAVLLLPVVDVREEVVEGALTGERPGAREAGGRDEEAEGDGCEDEFAREGSQERATRKAKARKSAFTPATRQARRAQLTTPTTDHSQPLPPAHGIIPSTRKVEVPILLQPLQEFEVVLHLAVDEAVHGDGLRGRVGERGRA